MRGEVGSEVPLSVQSVAPRQPKRPTRARALFPRGDISENMSNYARSTRCSKIMSLVPSTSSSANENIDLNNECPDDNSDNELLNNKSDLDFDSDDSVLDKDYMPSSLELLKTSEDSDCSVDIIPNSQPINITIPESPDISDEETTSQNLTKRGEARKRKKYEKTPAERKEQKRLSDMENKYKLKPGCNDNCKKKCHNHFTEEARKALNYYYRNMSWKEQQYFIINNTSKEQPRRNTVKENRKMTRNVTVSYYLTNETGAKINVCKIFFLETLGYSRKNDKSVRTALNTETNTFPIDRRGTNPNPKKLDLELETLIIQHINSFKPAVSHYRREHAPNRKYLPSDLSVVKMYEMFCEQQNMNDHSDSEKISYETYRKIVKSQNISFTKLGNEECDICEMYFLHNPDHKLLSHIKCQQCLDYGRHRDNYILARQAYQNDVEKQNNSNSSEIAYYAADLEKVIMLPRMEEFKKVIFCPRIIVFNESFVPIGDKKHNPNLKTYAAIWHEATSGRKAVDIISCFKSFLSSVRDLKHVVIWLDNCASQNKNWALFSYLVHLVNSSEVSFQTVKLKYLEAGHTHMAADEFHHQVELSMKRKKRIYDFEDFHQTVLSTRTNITVKVMSENDFCYFEDCASTYKLQNSSPRAYLGNMCEVTFSRGTHIMRYKTTFFDENEYTLDFLKLKNIKHGIPGPRPKNECRGITEERKSVIIQKLTPLMPDNRKIFWYNLPVNNNNLDLVQDYEE